MTKLTDKEIHDLLQNAKKKFNSLKLPKIKRYNPFETVGSSIQFYSPLDDLIQLQPKFSKEDMESYKQLYEDREKKTFVPNGEVLRPFSNDTKWIVNPDKSVRWNYTGYKLLMVEYDKKKNAEVNKFFDDLKAKGYNNKEEMREFKNNVRAIFVNLMNKLYPDSEVNEYLLDRYRSKRLYNDTLEGHLRNVLTTSTLNAYYQPFSPAVLYRYYKDIVLDYYSATDIGFKTKNYLIGKYGKDILDKTLYIEKVTPYGGSGVAYTIGNDTSMNSVYGNASLGTYTNKWDVSVEELFDNVKYNSKDKKHILMTMPDGTERKLDKDLFEGSLHYAFIL